MEFTLGEAGQGRQWMVCRPGGRQDRWFVAGKWYGNHRSPVERRNRWHCLIALQTIIFMIYLDSKEHCARRTVRIA